MANIAFLYPGQGAQVVGMGRDVYEQHEQSRLYLDAVAKELDFDLKTLMFEGPTKTLGQTEYTQPALVACELMLTKIVLAAGIVPQMVGGLSLGEYAALVVAGALDEMDAVKLVRLRGQLMANALPPFTTSMAAVIGLEKDILEDICQHFSGSSRAEIANDNCPGQLVIGGHIKSVEEAGKYAIEKGAKRVMPLNVSGAFHTSLLKVASGKFEQVLDDYSFKDLQIPVVFNATAQYQNASLTELLVRQMYSQVRFRESIELMIADGIDTFIEIGPGKTLSGLVKKINRDVAIYQVSTMADVEKLKEVLGVKHDE